MYVHKTLPNHNIIGKNILLYLYIILDFHDHESIIMLILLTGGSGGDDFPIGAIIGIAIAGALLLVILVIVLICCCVYCIKSRNKNSDKQLENYYRDFMRPYTTPYDGEYNKYYYSIVSMHTIYILRILYHHGGMSERKQESLWSTYYYPEFIAIIST